MIVDAHLHVFRPASVHPRAVDALAPAGRDAPAEDLLAVMAETGIDKAVLVPLGPEDDYVAETVAAHPGRFAAIAVADRATQGRGPGDPVETLRARLDRGFSGLRTQWLGDPSRPLAESPMLPVLRELADRGLPLWSYLPPAQLPAPRAARHGRRPADRPQPPGLRAARHARGRARPARVRRPFPPPVAETVLGLARHPHTYLMFSGQYALSRQEPPYTDLFPVVRAFAGAYGADRMLWASDYPWTRDNPGPAELLRLAGRTLPGLSPSERAALHGGTALTLLPTLKEA